MHASANRLSALDDSFLTVESPTAHMHVGWAAVFEPPAGRSRPRFEDLRAHIGARLSRAPRYRQKLCSAPLELGAPCWIDDREFDLARHVTRASSDDLDDVVATCMSEQLDRARPLWEVRIADRLADGRIGVVGKAHTAWSTGRGRRAGLAAARSRARYSRRGRGRVEAPGGARDGRAPCRHRGGAGPRSVGAGARRARSPERAAPPARAPLAVAEAAAGTLGRTLRPATPVAPLNEPISPERRLGQGERPLADLQRVKAPIPGDRQRRLAGGGGRGAAAPAQGPRRRAGGAEDHGAGKRSG